MGTGLTDPKTPSHACRFDLAAFIDLGAFGVFALFISLLSCVLLLDSEVSAAVGANIAFVVGACFASCAFGTCRKSLAGNGLFDDLRERKAPPIPCLRALIIFVVAVVVFSMVVVTVVVVVVVSMARMTTT